MGPKKYYKGFNLISRGLNHFGLSLEVMNTYIPENRKKMINNLRGLLQIPRMSTFAIGSIISKGIAEMGSDLCFLNVGVWHGFSFLSGIHNNNTKKCIGVDNFSQFGGPKHEFYQRFTYLKSPEHHFFESDYKTYFSEIHRDMIGFYIYDGEHDYNNQLQGLKVAEPFFADGCIILVDDTNSEDPKQATMEFISNSKNSYRILLDVETLFNMHPTFWNGIMVFQKVN